jgi:hypothetical protein
VEVRDGVVGTEGEGDIAGERVRVGTAGVGAGEGVFGGSDGAGEGGVSEDIRIGGCTGGRGGSGG